MVRKFRLLWFQNQNGITENPSGHKMAPFISELKTVKKKQIFTDKIGRISATTYPRDLREFCS